MLITYCLALPSVRFVLKSKSPNDKQLALTKPPSTLKQAIKACFGRFRKVVDSLDEASCTVGSVAVTGLFPTNETAALSKGNRFYIFVNDRPAGLKDLRKRTKAMWQPLIGDRFPWMVLKISSKACSWFCGFPWTLTVLCEGLCPSCLHEGFPGGAHAVF